MSEKYQSQAVARYILICSSIRIETGHTRNIKKKLDKVNNTPQGRKNINHHDG
jgi:hypothetical protein